MLFGRAEDDERALFVVRRNRQVRADLREQRDRRGEFRVRDGIGLVGRFVFFREDFLEELFDRIELCVEPPRDDLIAHGAGISRDAERGEIRVHDTDDAVAAVARVARHAEKTHTAGALVEIAPVFDPFDDFFEIGHILFRTECDEFVRSGRLSYDRWIRLRR